MKNQKKVDWEKLNIALGQKTREKEYWLKQLSGELIKSNFPFDFKPEMNSEPGEDKKTGLLAMRFNEKLYGNLMKLSKGSDYTLYVILAAGLTTLINKYSDNTDILIGAPIYKQETQKKLINTVLILRSRWDGDITFKQLLLQMKQTIFTATEHYGYPLERLMEQLNVSVCRDDSPPFEAALLLENIHSRNYISHIKPGVIFCFSKTGEYIEMVLEYNSLLYCIETIERIANHYKILLEKVLGNLNVMLTSIDVLTEGEKKELLYRFNDSGPRDAEDKSIPHYFEKQVAMHPHHIALVYGDKHMTYARLNEKANQLARLLRGKGIGRDCIVGLLIDRSLDMIIAIIGILKAGAAYFPIPPELHETMISSMLADCQVPVLATTAPVMENKCFTLLQGLQIVKEKPLLTATRPQITHLDGLPIPDRSLVDYEKYIKFICQAPVKNIISMQATRGCPYKCLYCHKIWPKNHVTRSAENIFREVEIYYRMGIRRFALIDDIFNLDIRNSSTFFQKIIENRLEVQLFFPSGMRGDILTAEYMDLMFKAGTVGLPLALETASPRLQKLIKKNLNLDKFRENIQYICEKYPEVILELYTMHGFPTETVEEALMTMDFLKSIKWVHFPYIFILKIWENTDMGKLAIENGISRQTIIRSENLAYHELPDTLPFDKGFTRKYQSEMVNEYFLSKERLLHVLPFQMKVFTEDEMTQRYSAYLNTDIKNLPDLLQFLGIDKKDLAVERNLDEAAMYVPDLNEKLRNYFPVHTPGPNAFKILLLDLSQFFDPGSSQLDDLVETPLGLMYLLTYLYRQFGEKINGKIAKSRIDFENYRELKKLIEEFEPDLIGIRTLTMYRDLFHQTTAVIKQWGFDVPIAAGGPYATNDYQTILQDSNIDLAVLGEGEITLSELVSEMMRNNGKLPGDEVLKGIAGLSFIPGKTKPREKLAREILLLDTAAGMLSKECGENPGYMSRSPDPAYVIFTSGSTGKPKGTIISHRNVTGAVRNTNYIRLTGNDRVLQLSNYAFDGSVFDIFAALLNGTGLVLLNNQDILELDRLPGLLKKEKITVFFVTTALFNTLVDLRVDAFSNTRKVLFGGERVSLEHAARALNRMGKGKILHMYGPTETTVFASYYRLDEIDKRRETIPIGKPVSAAKIYILARNLSLVPPGAAGQICIGGDGVSPGYLNRPELTAEKFVGNPFVRGERMYFSGDLGRFLQGENIQFIGRIDNQVKIRGFRIEPGEIEMRLMQVECIRKAVVIDREDKDGQKYLCAYILPSGELTGDFDTEEIRKNLSMNLPDYMVPRHFFQLRDIPLNPNGKVDRKALPGPKSEVKEGYLAPGNKLENKIAEIWSDVLTLEKEKISIKDNFFELGGHSLNTMLMIAKIHKEFQVKLPIALVFKTPNIMGISAYIKDLKKEKYDSLEPGEKKEYYELSSVQKRLYILQQMAPGSTTYNIPEIINMEEHWEMEKMEKIFNKLIQRHESFKTSFHLIEEKPVQVIHENVDFKIEYFDLGANKGRGGTVKSIIHGFVRPFDLGLAPLLRVGLIKEKNRKHIFLVDMHHVIADGMSMKILIREFKALCKDHELEPLKIQYKDFSEWQSRDFVKKALKSQEEYWLAQLEDRIPVLNLPADYKRPDNRQFEGDTIGFDIDADIGAQLRKLAREENVTPFMVFFALFTVFLSKLTLQEDIVIGTDIAGRRHPDVEHIVGMFVNTLAIRSFPGGNKRFIEFLLEVKEGIMGAFENQEYPFEDLVNRVVEERIPGRNPLFDIMFSYQDLEIELEIETGEMSETETGPLYENKTAKFDWLFNVTEAGGKFVCGVEYNTLLYKEERIKRYIKVFEEITRALLQDKTVYLKDIPIAISNEFLEAETGQLAMDFDF